MKVACVGVGNMGGAVARHLAAGDFIVHAFDPDPAAVARCLEAGALKEESLAAVVESAEVVLTSLPTTALVTQTIDALVGLATPGTVIVDISTIDPSTARRAADRCEAAQRDFIACPLGKTPAHAERGEIPLFVGGPAPAVEKVSPLLERMGDEVYSFGTVEAATTFKLVSNLIGMTNVAILAEGYALARRAGIDPDVFAAALKHTGAASFQEEVRLPWIIEQDWSARFGVDLALKDVRLAVESANSWKVPVPVASASLEQLTSASAQGYGAEDVVALAKLCDPALEDQPGGPHS